MKKPIIDVIVKQPGHPPFRVSCQNELETMQSLVEGYIEVLPLATDLVILCNEEGRLCGMAHNCNICGVDFVGPIVFVGVDGEEFDSVPLTISQAKELFPQMWEVG